MVSTDGSTDIFADKRRELGQERAKIEREIATLREKQAEIDLELEAIAAYDEVKARKTRSQQAQVDALLKGGPITQEVVLAIVAGEANGAGVGRGEIIDTLGVKGNRSKEVAVDNRLRELKRDGRIEHEGRVYRLPS